jgi:hypothetical protein
MAINTVDKLVAALASGITVPYHKASVAGSTGTMVSQWRASGNPGAGAIPGSTARYPDNTTTGALVNLPSLSPLQVYLAYVASSCTAAGTSFIMDRLADISGLNGTLNTAQAAVLDVVAPAAQGRCNSTGSDVEWYLEWYATTGSSAVTATVTYLDSAGATKTSTISLAASRPTAFMSRIIQDAGDDLPIKSIVSVQLSATTGTAGNFGVTAVRRIASVLTGVANFVVPIDYAMLGLPTITDKACLFLVNINATTSTGVTSGVLKIISG